MKRLGILLLGATALCAFEYGLAPQKVGEGLYCFFGAPEAMNAMNNGNMVNSCFADMGSGWLVIDSGPTYRYAEEALAAMQKIKTLPVRYVVNTHAHDDHWLGNDFYLKHGATVLGSEAFADENAATPTRMQSRISEEAYDKTVPVLPQERVGRERVIATPKGKIVVRPVGRRAHSAGDLYVYLPVYRAIFAGDLVFNDRLPSLRDGDINGWIAALETIGAMHPDVIVGGHGYRTDREAAAFTLAYLKQLRSEVRAVINEGGGIDDAVQTVRMEAFRSAGMYDTLHQSNVNSAFRMLEWEDE
jgi:glyoxylase-like metal-dependent hydrolase (beta-lactamase superfamily II)